MMLVSVAPVSAATCQKRDAENFGTTTSDAPAAIVPNTE